VVENGRRSPASPGQHGSRIMPQLCLTKCPDPGQSRATNSWLPAAGAIVRLDSTKKTGRRGNSHAQRRSIARRLDETPSLAPRLTLGFPGDLPLGAERGPRSGVVAQRAAGSAQVSRCTSWPNGYRGLNPRFGKMPRLPAAFLEDAKSRRGRRSHG